MERSAASVLDAVVARHPAGVRRPGQVAMLEAVETAIAEGRHLLVEAGTGTGKSMAYLIPALLAATGGDDDEPTRVVVATATKALQEQLVGKDLPFLSRALRDLGVSFRYAMLKGRANYLCVAKAADEVAGQAELLESSAADDETIEALAWWAWSTPTGDRSDYPEAVPDRVWSRVATDSVECPGAGDCAFGSVCFAEAARRRAAAADIVVVNMHLYALDLDNFGTVLPDHDVVVLDEAHAMEDVAASVFGLTLSEGRVRFVARRARRVIAGDLTDRLERTGRELADTLSSHDGRVLPGTGDIALAVGRVRDVVGELRSALKQIDKDTDEVRARMQLVGRLANALEFDCERALALTDLAAGEVAWVEPQRAGPQLRLAPVDVGPLVGGRLGDDITMIATSATLSVAGDFAPTAFRLGLRDDVEWDGLVVASPFDYQQQALLYCAVHLPDRRHPGFVGAMHDELAALITAAGGRTLALFTSRAAMTAAAAAVGPRLADCEVIVQDELPRPELVRRLQAGGGVAVFATQSFWQGVDVPGSALLLVTIDRLPFPRPDDPLYQARRDVARAAGEEAFATVDLPRAATLLAQGVGRLIRSDTDRGVVAVFDRRLSFARYAWTLVNSLPPMRRTRHREEAVAFLQEAVQLDV